MDDAVESASDDTTAGQANDGVPDPIAALEPGAVLRDRHRKEWFLVREVTDRGTRLEQDGEEFYVPHSLFVTWVDSRLFPVDESDTVDFPKWLAEIER
jgi:hypothetical protein